MLALTILTGCVSATRESFADLPSNAFSLKIENDLIVQSFNLKLTNNTNKSICIDAQDWPNNMGQLHFAADVVYAVFENTKYPIKDRNLGYCLNGCKTVIAANSSITGQIPFSEFQGNFENLAEKNIALVYSISPFYCK